MDLRVRAMSANARTIADRLPASNPKISTVRYPGRPDHPHHNIHAAQMPDGGGSLVAFSIKGGKSAAYAMLNELGLVDISRRSRRLKDPDHRTRRPPPTAP